MKIKEPKLVKVLCSNCNYKFIVDARNQLVNPFRKVDSSQNRNKKPLKYMQMIQQVIKNIFKNPKKKVIQNQNKYESRYGVETIPIENENMSYEITPIVITILTIITMVCILLAIFK